jgi:hypothetical protein
MSSAILARKAEDSTADCMVGAEEDDGQVSTRITDLGVALAFSHSNASRQVSAKW